MKVRVLHISHSPAFSGAEQALFRLLSRTDRDRFDPLVALPGDGRLRAALTEIGVRTAVLDTRWWIPATHWTRAEFMEQLHGLEQRWQAVARLATEEKIDLIHTNTIVTIEGALAAQACGIPHLWHSRGLFFRTPASSFPPKYFHDWGLFFAIIDDLGDQIACVSHAVLEQTTHFVRRVPCTVIPDGFDAAPERSSTRAEFNADFALPGHARVIACIGGVERRKGQLDLVEAFAEIAGRYPDAILFICGDTGDTEYVARVRKRISDLDLESRVRLLGFRDDVASLIHHCALVVHPAHSEGFGLAVLEAMAAAKPVVATRSGGPEEMIEDRISGLLVPPEAPTRLAQAMERVLANAEFASGIANSARLRSAKFTTTESAKQFERLIEKMVSARSRKLPGLDHTHQMCQRVLEEIKNAPYEDNLE
jgi:glycosyltransferase involved in cell wall biosynthesis